MRVSSLFACLIAFATLGFASAGHASLLVQGPESVFSQPVSSIFPELDGATRTQDSETLTDQLSYWGYKLTDGRELRFYVCSERQGSSCADQATKICHSKQTTIVKTAQTEGLVTFYTCRNQCHIIEQNPMSCCTRREAKRPLTVGLASCN